MPELADLERDLVALGARLDVPSDAYLATRVRTAVERAPGRRRRLVIVVAALVGIGAVSAPVVADRLGVGRVEVRHEPPPASAPTSPLDLGQRTTLRAARAAIDFDIAVPAALGAPDEVWIDESSSSDVVWLAYRPRADLPEAKATGYGALVAEIDGSINEALFGKFVEPKTAIEHVDLGTGPALWIDGVHYIAVMSRDGDFVGDRLRLSDRVLLWERGDVTLRIESSLDKEASLRIARTAG